MVAKTLFDLFAFRSLETIEDELLEEWVASIDEYSRHWAYLTLQETRHLFGLWLRMQRLPNHLVTGMVAEAYETIDDMVKRFKTKELIKLLPDADVLRKQLNVLLMDKGMKSFGLKLGRLRRIISSLWASSSIIICSMPMLCCPR